MTKEKDIVLINIENKPVSFARIEKISSDSKPNWFKVKLLFLQIPINTVIWTLKEEYINGDIFLMNGQSIRLEKIPFHSEKKKKKTRAQIVPLFGK